METQNSIAVTTLNANQISKSDYFGYSSVISSDSTKVQNFKLIPVSEHETKASWSITNKVKNGTETSSYVCTFQNSGTYKHGTIGRYLQSITKFQKNSFLHSFGNTPILTLEDLSEVFNIPLQLLTSPQLQIELIQKIADFSNLDTSDTKDVKEFLSYLSSVGLVIDSENTYASKIQSMTSLQKNYVYYKENTYTLTFKREYTDTHNIVLTLKFENESDKKDFGTKLENILTDASIKLKETNKTFVKASKDEKKQMLFDYLQANLARYQRKAMHAKLELSEISKDESFDLDSLFD